MFFTTPLKRARITYAALMASCTCVVMSAVSTSVLRPIDQFWDYWPHLLAIDIVVAVPVAIMLGPIIRRICGYIYPDLPK
ncbi:MAG: DUF2798 domain-containing protein [Alphaproteobacteria bacterium]|nr:DUF2798 domain-containing protein [Alphaproteobacteria bacterium]